MGRVCGVYFFDLSQLFHESRFFFLGLGICFALLSGCLLVVSSFAPCWEVLRCVFFDFRAFVSHFLHRFAIVTLSWATFSTTIARGSYGSSTLISFTPCFLALCHDVSTCRVVRQGDNPTFYLRVVSSMGLWVGNRQLIVLQNCVHHGEAGIQNHLFYFAIIWELPFRVPAF